MHDGPLDLQPRGLALPAVRQHCHPLLQMR